MKLYNSLTKKLETFKSIKEGEVGLYTCGPTVYDLAHIGNLRTYVFEDTLRRTLKLAGYKLRHVMNITDVDDKVIARSRTDYPKLAPGAAMSKLSHKYEAIFLKDVSKLGIDLNNSKIVRATDHIQAMQKLIRAIPCKYIADDGVYFDINKYPAYGALTKLDRSHQHHRIDNDEYDKDHVADFALWKTKKPNEPSWPFELDGKDLEGRPGWHIECSAMSTQYLGQPFDIHSGGVDLKFPHHENEIAQSKSANVYDLAKYWVHGEHLLVDGKKMSKSKKNFHTLDDIEEKQIDPLAFRLLILQSHYRSKLNFTWKSLAAAQATLAKIKAFGDLRWQQAPSANKTMPPEEIYTTGQATMTTYLTNDLNTPAAVAELFKIVDYANSGSSGQLASPGLVSFLAYVDSALGLGLLNTKDIDNTQKVMLRDRQQARASGDWKHADAIRTKLLAQSINVRDTESGQIWSRV